MLLLAYLVICMSVSLRVLLTNLIIDVAELCNVICSIDDWKKLRIALRCYVYARQIAKKMFPET